MTTPIDETAALATGAGKILPVCFRCQALAVGGAFKLAGPV